MVVYRCYPTSLGELNESAEKNERKYPKDWCRRRHEAVIAAKGLNTHVQPWGLKYLGNF